MVLLIASLCAMQEVIIIVAAVLASLLTLVSGFGLGTLMLPVFALFFPVEVAVGMTAVVHLLNNLFKFGLMRRHVDKKVFLWFGIPGIIGAWLGARAMLLLGRSEDLFMGVRMGVDLLDLVIAVLMALFAVLELWPKIAAFKFDRRYLVPGGILSGLFGGLSGHQGALRSMFLLHSGLTKELFIVTGIAIALLVDITRIPVYFGGLSTEVMEQGKWLVVAATLASFLGAYIGKQLIPKITFRSVQVLVGILMLGISAALAIGLI